MEKLLLNLRLFDKAGTVTTADSGMTVEMKTYYDKDLLENAKPYLVHDQFAQQRDIPKNGGKTIEFRRFSPLPKAMTPLTEGVTPDGKKISATNITATIQQYGDYVELSDVVQMTTLDKVLLEANELLGAQAGETLDAVTREVINGGTSVQYAAKDVQARYLLENKPITLKALEIAAATLKAKNAPKINGDYVAIMHPHTVYDLRQDADWQEVANYAAPSERLTNEVGRIAGIRVVESTEAKIFKGEPLSESAENLTVASTSGKVITVSETLTAADQAAIAGRKVIIGATTYTVNAAAASTITVDETLQSDVTENAVVYPGEGGAKGAPVYSTLVIGKNAYATSKVEGMGLEMIVKQLGSAGTADPLNQRGTAGWKASKTAVILQDTFMVRIEHTATLAE